MKMIGSSLLALASTMMGTAAMPPNNAPYQNVSETALRDAINYVSRNRKSGNLCQTKSVVGEIFPNSHIKLSPSEPNSIVAGIYDPSGETLLLDIFLNCERKSGAFQYNLELHFVPPAHLRAEKLRSELGQEITSQNVRQIRPFDQLRKFQFRPSGGGAMVRHGKQEVYAKFEGNDVEFVVFIFSSRK